MTALLAFLFTNPIILAVGAGIIGAAVAWMHGRVTGAKAERAQSDRAGTKATTEGEQIDGSVAGRAPDANS
ncbi:hypothetical protein ACWGTI_29815 [Mesorhizobium sp. ArgA1]